MPLRTRAALILIGVAITAATGCTSTVPPAPTAASSTSVIPTSAASVTSPAASSTQAASSSKPTPSSSSESSSESATAATSTGPAISTPASGAGIKGAPETVVTGLQTPWGIGFLPDGRALVTERDTGAVKIIAKDHSVSTAGTIDGVVPDGEGGLLGLAVSPSFRTDSTIMVYYTAADDNRVARLTLGADDRLSGQRVVLGGIPKNSTHNGGRMTFGPDGFLYIGTGDAQGRESAPDPTYLGGKILRMAIDGSPAPEHPFPEAPLVFSLGHRNVQGLAFDPQGRLWASEFGQNTWDELNLITAGGNYGWPTVEGPSTQEGFIAPQRVWSTSEASPSGIAILAGSVWMAGLRGQRLWQIPLVGAGTADPVAHFAGEFGRLRTVVVAPDGSLWLTTSNTDGRGDARDGDDRILRITLS